MLKSTHASWLNGSYLDDRDYLLKVAENNQLRQGIDVAANLSPQFDGSNSIAIGYGLDLLVNDDATIDNYLTSAGLPVLTSTDKQVLANARVARNANLNSPSLGTILVGFAGQLSLTIPSEQNENQSQVSHCCMSAWGPNDGAA